MSCYGGLQGIVSGLTKSTDHPSRLWASGRFKGGMMGSAWSSKRRESIQGEYRPCLASFGGTGRLSLKWLLKWGLPVWRFLGPMSSNQLKRGVPL